MPLYVNILIIFILFIFNAIFAMYEIAMVSSKKTRLVARAEDGQKGASVAMELLQDPDQQYLSAIQIMITMIDTLAGGIGGAQLSRPLAEVFKRVNWLAPFAEIAALIIVVIIITYFSIVLGELIPKRIAVSKPEDVVTKLSPMIRGLTNAVRPLTKLLSGSTNLGIKIFNIDVTREPAITEEELKGYIQEGRQTGVFDEAEQTMVDGVFRFTDRRVDAIMTPHTELDWINLDDDHDTIVKELMESNYSRMPIAHGDLDRSMGIINTKDLLGVDIHNPQFNLEDYLREPLFFPGNMEAVKAFEQFRQTGIHHALVLDEFGGVEGFVTLYDVLESIVGDIPLDEYDKDQDVVQRSDGTWLVDGLIPIDELKEIMDVDELPEEDKAGFQTLSGFVMNQLGRIPKTGSLFEWSHWRFEVVDMDGHRVDRVLVTDISNEEKPSVEI
ncbi:MAG TPA: hemolysin family protein [Anaerolineaceae bacterium]|nr:hemolysin family protein [Anaerolineaceae bacterium]